MSRRPRARVLLRGGGERVATLSSGGAAHAVTLRAIQASLPRRFDPGQAQDLVATMELRVRRPRGGGATALALRITHGELEVAPGPAHDPGAAVELGADDMIRLAAGAVGWPELISAGRLSLSGDPFLALRFPALFRLPVRAG
jgi:hypothetical protein